MSDVFFLYFGYVISWCSFSQELHISFSFSWAITYSWIPRWEKITRLQVLHLHTYVLSKGLMSLFILNLWLVIACQVKDAVTAAMTANFHVYHPEEWR